MKKTFVRVATAVMMLGMTLFIVNCGSSGDSTPSCTSYADFAGTWSYTGTNDERNCGGVVETVSGTFSVSQASGSSSATVTIDSNSYPASVCNNTLTGSATYPDGSGTTSETVTATVSGNSMTVSSSWTYTEVGWGTCSGTAQLSATKL